MVFHQGDIIYLCCCPTIFVLLKYSAKATEEYELARKKIASFINASDSREIVFTRNATEAINLVAYSWGLQNLKQEDEVRFCPLRLLCILFKLYMNLT